MDSRTVRNLLHVMSNFGPAQRREFLQFITGSPKLPIGGKYFISFLHQAALTLEDRFQEPDAHVHGCLQT